MELISLNIKRNFSFTASAMAYAIYLDEKKVTSNKRLL